MSPPLSKHRFPTWTWDGAAGGLTVSWHGPRGHREGLWEPQVTSGCPYLPRGPGTSGSFQALINSWDAPGGQMSAPHHPRWIPRACAYDLASACVCAAVCAYVCGHACTHTCEVALGSGGTPHGGPGVGMADPGLGLDGWMTGWLGVREGPRQGPPVLHTSVPISGLSLTCPSRLWPGGGQAAGRDLGAI